MYGGLGYQTLKATQAGTEALGNIVENISNSKSVGYKKDQTTFVETLNGEISKYETKDFSQGPLRMTGQMYDFAIDGPGFFEVELQNGQRAYTRAGKFRLSSDGELVTDEGYRIVPLIEQTQKSPQFIFERDSGEQSSSLGLNLKVNEVGVNLKVAAPKLLVPPNLTPNVESDGTIYGVNEVTGEKAKLGRINVAIFNNPQGLESIGQGYYLGTKSAGQPQDTEVGPNAATKVRQGFLELGNVDLVSELMSLGQLRNLLTAQFKTLKTLDKIYENVHYTISKSA